MDNYFKYSITELLVRDRGLVKHVTKCSVAAKSRVILLSVGYIVKAEAAGILIKHVAARHK